MPFTNPMRRASAPPATPRDLDLELQAASTRGEEPHRSRFTALHLSRPPYPGSSSSTEKSSPQLPDGVHGEESHRHAERTSNNPAQSEPDWKPWKLDDPYLTEVPQDEQAMEKWVEAMKESDDGMCRGWTDQIDTLIIFAGLFSATVTAFTIESYRWLEETQADMVARLQLRALLNAAHDPAVDILAPTTFRISPSSVLINTFWFASLTLALGAVVVSILCKQWLYEYQRYENLTVKEIFLIRGLRYRGLKAWRVPEIIAFLPILLQIALALFLVGLLILLGPLQPVVAAIITAIVGLIFLFMAITTILPSIQYMYPKFDTQCAYKSSQSWSFFVLSAFWLFDFSMFTTWVAFDHWEVSCISDGTGLTLSRVYELLSNSADAFRSIYVFLADLSLRPATGADLSLLHNFVDGLDSWRRDDIMEVISQTTSNESLEYSKRYRRLEQLKGYIDQYYKAGPGQLKPSFEVFNPDFKSGFDKHEINTLITPAYHLQTQIILGRFLRYDTHFSTPAILNRYIEHWTRYIDNGIESVKKGEQQLAFDDKGWKDIYWAIEHARKANVLWDPEIGSHLVEMHSRLLRVERISQESIRHISVVYASLVESYKKHHYHPPPHTLLKSIQELISRIPETDLSTKVYYAQFALYRMVYKGKIFTEVPDPEKQHLRSFAQFFVEFFNRNDISNEQRESFWGKEHTGPSLEVLRNYLERNPPVTTPPESPSLQI